MTRSITGWKISEPERAALLVRFPPRYRHVVADHVTLRFGIDETTPLPAACSGTIVGEADDGSGVQALVVMIGGSTERGDGSHYHITWSLGEGREAKESSGVIAQRGWAPIAPAIRVELEPARWTG